MAHWIAYVKEHLTPMDWLRMQVAHNTAQYINTKISSGTSPYTFDDLLLKPAKPKTEEEIKREADLQEYYWITSIQLLKSQQERAEKALDGEQ